MEAPQAESQNLEREKSLDKLFGPVESFQAYDSLQADLDKKLERIAKEEVTGQVDADDTF